MKKSTGISLLILLLPVISLSDAYLSTPGATYVRIGATLMDVPYAWSSSGSPLQYSEQDALMGFYGQTAFTSRFGVIISGSPLLYEEAEYIDEVPQKRTTSAALAGPWSVMGTAQLVEWKASGLGLEAGLNWYFAGLPGSLGPQAVAQVDLARKLDRFNSKLWADLSAHIAVHNDTRPRGTVDLGIEVHDPRWRWEAKGLFTGTAAIDRSGPIDDSVIGVTEQQVNTNSSYVTVASSNGRYLGDSYSGGLAFTWYPVKGVGIDILYQQTFWGLGASATRAVGFGVSYGWMIQRKKN